MPPPEVSAYFLARVNARINADGTRWFALADFRAAWTLRLAPAAAAMALVAALWSGAAAESSV